MKNVKCGMDNFLLARVCSVDDFPKEKSVGFALRDEQLNDCDGETKFHRQCVWLLLRQLLAEVGLDECSAGLHLLENGKWTGDGVYVSLSHCKGFVAAAVSDVPVGIDVERLDRKISPCLFGRIVTTNERELYGEHPPRESVLALWTAKEAAFKASDGENAAMKIDTTLFDVSSCVRGKVVFSVARLK